MISDSGFGLNEVLACTDANLAGKANGLTVGVCGMKELLAARNLPCRARPVEATAAMAPEMTMAVERPRVTRNRRENDTSASRPDGEWVTNTQCRANSQHAANTGIAVMGIRCAAAMAGKGAETLASQKR